ncbi:hypothetical protein ASD65_10590 [Microbacterium sp. Root61]|nr:hypothetical protein ASD65_10590 [Microbacterium sp. Root61]
MGARVARSAATLPGVVVGAIIDVDEARARDVAASVGAVAAGSLEEACAVADIDAVYIGLPNAVHRDAGIEAARRNLHVLIDKPLTTDLADADAVLSAAASSSGFWMMGFSYRFREEWRRAREIIRSGGIGEPYFVSDNVIEAYRVTPAWYWSAEAGGGTLHLQSHHVFDRWEWLLGADVTAVSAQTPTTERADAELAVVVAARMGPSIVGSSAMSFGVGYDAPPRISFTVQGTRGMLELDETRRLTVATAEGLVEELHSDDDWLVTQLSAFIAGARGVLADQPTLAAGRRAVQLAEAAALSTSDGAWISTPRSLPRIASTGATP